MKDEIRTAIRKMKLGKATGSDSVSVKLLEALEGNGFDKIATLPNEIYETGQIYKSVFIALKRYQGQQSANRKELSVLRVISLK